MAYCSKCGTQLREGAKFCPKCGTPAETTPTKRESSDISSNFRSEQINPHRLPHRSSGNRYSSDGILDFYVRYYL